MRKSKNAKNHAIEIILFLTFDSKNEVEILPSSNTRAGHSCCIARLVPINSPSCSAGGGAALQPASMPEVISSSGGTLLVRTKRW